MLRSTELKMLLQTKFKLTLICGNVAMRRHDILKYQPKGRISALVSSQSKIMVKKADYRSLQKTFGRKWVYNWSS